MLQYILFKLIQLLLSISPRWLSYKVGRLTARLYYLYAVEARDAVRSNIAHILDYTRGNDDSPARRVRVNRLARETFENFAVHLADFFDIASFGRGAGAGRIEVMGVEKLDRVLEAGRGVIAITAHIGNWELGPRVLTDMGYRFGAVEIKHENRWLDKFFTDLRVNSGAQMAHEGFEIRHILKILKENGLATFVIDRDESGNGRKVMLFGEEATLLRGAPEFSCRTGAPIIPGFMIQVRDGEFRLVFDDPINPAADMDKETRLEAIYSELVGVLEKYIARYPSQWFIFYKVWPQLQGKSGKSGEEQGISGNTS